MNNIVNTLIKTSLILISLNTFSSLHAQDTDPIETSKTTETIKDNETIEYVDQYSKEIEYDDLYGKETGYFHGFFSIASSSTDNINNSQDNKLSETLTILSSGVGIAFPAINKRLTPTNAGGDFLTEDSSRRFQSGLLYTRTVSQYSEYTVNDSDNQQFQTFLKYNFRGGLSAKFFGQGVQSTDNSNLNDTIEQDKSSFIVNRFSLSYIISQRTKLDFDYSSLDVDYEADRNTFRNHQEIGYSTGFFLPFLQQSNYTWNIKTPLSNMMMRPQIAQRNII